MLAIDFEQGLSDAWSDVAAFLPKLLGFLAILLLGYLIAKLLARVTDHLLERMGFDGWVERGVLRQTLERSRFDASDILATIVFWAVMLITLQLAFGIFGANPVSELIQGLIAYLPRVFAAVLILVIGAAVAKVVTDLLAAMLGAVSGGRWMARAAGIAILVVAIFAALDQLQIAPAILNGLFYGLLAIVVGSAIVAFGAGGIPVARRFLERWAAQVDAKAAEIRVKGDPDAARARADEATRSTEARMPEPGETGEMPRRAS